MGPRDGEKVWEHTYSFRYNARTWRPDKRLTNDGIDLAMHGDARQKLRLQVILFPSFQLATVFLSSRKIYWSTLVDCVPLLRHPPLLPTGLRSTSWSYHSHWSTYRRQPHDHPRRCPSSTRRLCLLVRRRRWTFVLVDRSSSTSGGETRGAGSACWMWSRRSQRSVTGRDVTWRPATLKACSLSPTVAPVCGPYSSRAVPSRSGSTVYSWPAGRHSTVRRPALCRYSRFRLMLNCMYIEPRTCRSRSRPARMSLA